MPAENELLDRVPPQNREAEQSVLGSMLRDNSCIDVVLQIVHKDDFYADAHQKIFETIVALNDRGGRPVDVILLAEALRERGWVEDVGGYAYLGELWDAAPTAANAEYYAQIVRDKALVRNLIRAGHEILGDAYQQTMPANDLVQAAERKILDIAQKGVSGQVTTLLEAIDETYDRIDRRSSGADLSASGIPTGFSDLDELTAGLHASELVIVAARPSVGKTAFALNLARHITVNEKAPVFFVSLEQSKLELAERMLCSQAMVDSHKLRRGTLTGDDMEKLIQAGSVLRSARLLIDDTPAQGMLRIAANARRLRRQHSIKVVMIDYLQLIEPDNRRDPRHEQVAQISRRLKFLAKELEIPVIALAQVNRASEDRQDHRPRLSDLRESGCLTGDTLVTMADTGARVPMRDLAGRSGFAVWALDELSWKLKPAEVRRAFATGVKPVFRLETRLGRVVRATANHAFRTLRGWARLDELRPGDRIAVPRSVPSNSTPGLSLAEVALLGHLIGDGCTLPRHAIQYTTREEELARTVVSLAGSVFGRRLNPRIKQERTWFQVYLSAADRLTHQRRNPVAEWLDALGVFGYRSWEKRVPALLFEQPAEHIALFLKHLWATDGCVRAPTGKTRHPALYYATSSEGLARDVLSLLLRVGINAVARPSPQGTKGRTQYHVHVMGRQDILTFADRVGAVGARRQEALRLGQAWVEGRKGNTNRDVIPHQFWRSLAVPLMQERGVRMRAFQSGLGIAFMGTGLYQQNVSRERMARVAAVLDPAPTLRALSESDVYWDEVRLIDPAGVEEVFDLTVPGPSNFLANDVIVHNSIEQDADVVMFIYRDEYYVKDSETNKGIAELIVAKHRSGATDAVELAFRQKYTLFSDLARGEA